MMVVLHLCGRHPRDDVSIANMFVMITNDSGV